MANHIYAVENKTELPEGRIRLSLHSQTHHTFNHEVVCRITNNNGCMKLHVEESSPINVKGDTLYLNPATLRASYCGPDDIP